MALFSQKLLSMSYFRLSHSFNAQALLRSLTDGVNESRSMACQELAVFVEVNPAAVFV